MSIYAPSISANAQVANVATAQTTSTTTYTDLATVGPAVTVTTGTTAFLSASAESFNSGAGALNLMSYAVSGATTVAASDANILSFTSGSGAGAEIGSGMGLLVTGLTPGSNTFTLKYRVTTGTGTFERRWITVIPL